ncbi:type II toxin-antitoxin system Rv0910 family toxin [Nocardia aurantiaca]|nr:SRPBCC domain-containing protein [Nocardia aurantiaca]
MGFIAIRRDLPGTPDAVFDTLIRPSTWEHWFSLHRDFVVPPPDRLSVGSTIIADVLMLGMADRVEWTVEALEPPRRVVLTGHGEAGIGCIFTYHLQPSSLGTTLTVDGLFTRAGMTRSLADALRKHGREHLDRTVSQLAAMASAPCE